ncbi:MAG: hypothetical protein Q9180_003839 [Flavoplaca navasiana]
MLAVTSSQPAILQQQSFSLDYLSRVWRFGWLRRDTPSESPSLTTMESHTTVEIVVFPEKEISEDGHGDGAITAQSDKSLPFSIISKGMLDRLGVTYTPCQQMTVTDCKNIQHSPIGKIKLRWHKSEGAKSYSEEFFVENTKSPQVILGETAFPAGNTISTLSGSTRKMPVTLLYALPHLVANANTSSFIEDEKLTLEQKKLQVAQRREQEKKVQEEKEAERRQQAVQKS